MAILYCLPVQLFHTIILALGPAFVQLWQRKLPWKDESQLPCESDLGLPGYDSMGLPIETRALHKIDLSLPYSSNAVDSCDKT